MVEARRTKGTYPTSITMGMLSLFVEQPHLAERLSEVTSLIELLTDDAETALVLDPLRRTLLQG